METKKRKTCIKLDNIDSFQSQVCPRLRQPPTTVFFFDVLGGRWTINIAQAAYCHLLLFLVLNAGLRIRTCFHSFTFGSSSPLLKLSCFFLKKNAKFLLNHREDRIRTIIDLFSFIPSLFFTVAFCSYIFHCYGFIWEKHS